MTSMMNRNRQCSRHVVRGVFKICDELRSPHEGACFGVLLSRPIGAGVCV